MSPSHLPVVKPNILMGVPYEPDIYLPLSSPGRYVVNMGRM